MSNNRLSILLIDDDRLVANALARLLRGRSYDVSICPDPKQALLFCDKYQFDLIITDQRMPVMDGTEFANIAKSKQPRAKIILISGYSDQKSVTDALDQEVIQSFLAKPWDNRQLLDVVENQIAV